MSGTEGANKMARAIHKAISQANEYNTYSPVLGTIQGDLGLLLDDFPITIPQGDYLVSEHLTLSSSYFTETESEEIDGEDISFRVKTPRQLAPLSAGDRVLCIPINQGRDYVVIGRVE